MVLQERGEKLCPLLWEERENLSVRCKDRTGNFNHEYLYQNEKELGIIFNDKILLPYPAAHTKILKTKILC